MKFIKSELVNISNYFTKRVASTAFEFFLHAPNQNINVIFFLKKKRYIFGKEKMIYSS
jgi:hypothetical protein